MNFQWQTFEDAPRAMENVIREIKIRGCYSISKGIWRNDSQETTSFLFFFILALEFRYPFYVLHMPPILAGLSYLPIVVGVIKRERVSFAPFKYFLCKQKR